MQHEGVHLDTKEAAGKHIHLPAPTAWPVILAFGCTLLAAAPVTTSIIGLLGGVLILFGCVGWFRQVLPHEQHEQVEVVERPVVVTSERTVVQRIQVDPRHRAHVPIETYPVTSGIKGGIAGGIAMIIPALIYGYIAQGSIWYTVNLLGGEGVIDWRHASQAQVGAFNWEALLVAIVIQTIACIMVGLLYGAVLPMLPRHPVLLGGIVAPVLWTGLLHSFMGIINPALADHIVWGWFLISQVTFGLVAGIVVARQKTVMTGQSLPFAARLGIEAPGLMASRQDAGPPIDKEKK